MNSFKLEKSNLTSKLKAPLRQLLHTVGEWAKLNVQVNIGQADHGDLRSSRVLVWASLIS